jgi:hypothetical protein
MRLLFVLALVTLMFVGSTFVALRDGKVRDAAEDAAVAVLLIGATALFARRYLFNVRKHARVSDLLGPRAKRR